MMIVSRRVMRHNDGRTVHITVGIQPRIFRQAVYHVVVQDSDRDDWDSHVRYAQGGELKWATNPHYRTETPDPAKLTHNHYTTAIQQYERMGYT